MKTSRKLLTSEFDYDLPKELIAQKPIKPRDSARLLILGGKISHQHFFDLPNILQKSDVLVLNDSKVIPARLWGKKDTGGKVEILLIKKIGKDWEVLIGGKIREGRKVFLKKNIEGKIIRKITEKTWLAKFNACEKKLFSLGETPLPRYIKSKSKLEDYQTVYAKKPGSIAAPTAGLHFTPRLLKKLKERGVKIVFVTLHVGLGTFTPVKTKYISEHKMHSELAVLDPKTAKVLNEAKKKGKRIVAAGTTTLRVLESFADAQNHLVSGEKWTDIFIYPGYKFKFADALITNFHLPESTLLMLVCAFAGKKRVMEAYQEAIKEKYLFYSFGDGMIIL